MKPEIKKLPIVIYRTSEGRPTCARSFKTGKVCIFYRSGNFGTEETCVFAPEGEDGKAEKIERVQGFLHPPLWCPVWLGESRDIQI